MSEKDDDILKTELRRMADRSNKDFERKWGVGLTPAGKIIKPIALFAWIPTIILFYRGLYTVADIFLVLWVVAGLLWWMVASKKS